MTQKAKLRRAPANASCWRAGSPLYSETHALGPYVASIERETGRWHVWWSDGVAAYCDDEKAALADLQMLADAWRETSQRKVYFIGTECRVGCRVKIGIAYEPVKRLRSLQTAHHEPLRLLGTMLGNGAAEKRLHTKFRRVRLQGEWFRITQTLKRLIEQCEHPSSATSVSGE